MVDDAMFASGTTEYGTPPKFYARLDAEYDFHLDAAACHENAKAPLYCTREGTFLRTDDEPVLMDTGTGLWMDWHSAPLQLPSADPNVRARVFVNPPYGRGKDGCAPWVRKAHREHVLHGILVVMLLPARTDTAWFHDHVLNVATVQFVKGRLSFERTFACCAHPEEAHQRPPGGGGRVWVCAGCRATPAQAEHRYAPAGASEGAPFPSMVAVYR